MCVCSLCFTACTTHAPKYFIYGISTVFFPHFLINGAIFGRIKTLFNKKCFDFLYNCCLELLSFLKQFSTILSQTSLRLHVKYPSFLSYLWNFNFHDRFSKNTPISNIMKICPAGAELFLADGRIESHDEVNSRISPFL